MGITVRKEKGVNDAVYYKAYDVGHVRGKIVQKYVGSIGKSQNSTGEVEPGVLLKYVERLVKKNVSQEEINQILRKIGIEYDIWPAIKIIAENELKMKREESKGKMGIHQRKVRSKTLEILYNIINRS